MRKYNSSLRLIGRRLTAHHQFGIVRLWAVIPLPRHARLRADRVDCSHSLFNRGFLLRGVLTSDIERSNAEAAAREILSVTRFQEELRLGVQSLTPPAIAGALAEVVKSIELNPAFAQSRLLARVLSALISQAGEFRRAEVFALDSKTRALVLALMDAFAAGIPGRDEWQRAVDSANAAQRGYG